MHQPRSQNFEARVRDSFGRQAIMKNLRAEIVELAAGRVVLQMPFQANFTQRMVSCMPEPSQPFSILHVATQPFP